MNIDLDCLCVSTVSLLTLGRGGRVVERRTVGRKDRDSKPPAAVSKPGQFRSPHFARVFRYTKSHWSLLPGVCARGSKRSHTGVNV